MAGMFDWMKGGKGGGRRRTSGRGDASKRKGGSQYRNPAKSTEFVGTPPRDDEPERSTQSTEFIAPASQADAGSNASQYNPTPPPPSAASIPASAPLHTPDPPPPPASETADQAPPPADAGATQYQSVGPATGGLAGVLIVKEGLSRDEIYKVFDGESTMGRGETAKIRTDDQDATVSREHAMIIHESGIFEIKPLKEGTNPTFLNESEVSGSAELVDGDLIRIGNTIMKFRVV
jgi:hypothetical protein